MEKRKLIRAAKELLYNAGIELDCNNHEGYCKYMSKLLDLLMKELIGEAPEPSQNLNES